MIYTSKMIQEILTSTSAKKALRYISPIYGDAEYFLRILNAIGSQLDVIWNFGQEAWNDIVPQTTQRLIDYWETEYGIARDPSKTLDERRDVLIQTIKTQAPVNPKKLEGFLSSIPGVIARVEENTGANRFTVWIASDAKNMAEIKRIIERSKPAHLSYTLLFEVMTKGNSYIGIIGSTGKNINIGQVN